MSLGVKRGTVKVVLNSVELLAEYEKERQILLKVFDSNFMEIEHIGSTTIPNINAKPIIDIAIKVENIDALQEIQKRLNQIGYIERIGRLSGRQKVYAKGSELNVTHHLHIIENGVKDWDEKVKFKNILLTNILIAKEYSELKINLASKYWNDRANYTKEKSIFIRKVLEQNQ
jgi:GrpB-like predicted nucleotidyltransferase (UPF0157 family)